ncbi:DUF948 domain-containing protein [Cytobacillus sp. NCCP-133]|uniref:DUF948 domain-containing protein n=1 Tax=Cytobacillus sp. NCCP-133 TaxID=766848 RepID=UPI002231D04E|nr:DUF948 domain-containing protein [Cytobacillus sp. NCCP-133]GLB58744.1 hypothetical protein NCCP133_08770 [Cytobacillus sp. NCCP-133]
MIIIYVSLALFAASLIFLGIYAIKVYKDAKPAIERLTAVSTVMQLKADQLKSGMDELKTTQQEIKKDIEYKKQTVNLTISAFKDTPKKIKKWGNINIPFIHQIK